MNLRIQCNAVFFCLAEDLLALQVGFCSMELVS